MIYDPFEDQRAKERNKVTKRRKVWLSVKAFCSKYRGYITIALIVTALIIASIGYR